MKTVIFCGGQGTRLREETEYRPKPLVEVGGRPVLWHIMKLYAHYGFNEFVLCLGYRGHMIKEYFLDYEARINDFTIQLGQKHEVTYHDVHEEQNFSVTLASTGEETMTGGRLKRVQRYIDGDTFLLTYGDGLANVDIKALVDFHHSHGKLATVTTTRPPSRFGVMEFGEGTRIDHFREKPQSEGWINAGYMVMNRRVFDYLGGDDCVFEQEPLQKLAAEGELMGFCHDGFFYAMDTYREYQLLNDIWNSGNIPWKVW
jgi:glucose-1-phosphate cytidylyltransferase